MSEAVTQAAYRFVDALNEYNASNSTAVDELLENEDPEDDTINPDTQARWDNSWDEYQAARDNLIDTVRVDRSVKLG